MISGCAGQWLNGAPDKLPHRQRQADGRDTQTRAGVDGTHIQAHGLANAHGDEENATGHQDREQNQGIAQA